MFEAAEVGRKVAKNEFKEREPDLHTRLLQAQRRLAGTDSAVIVIVAGVEGAGKGTVVNRFSEWLDARGMRTFAFWLESDEEAERPRFWRFWRVMPPRGSIGVMFGSWYTLPIVDHVYGRIGRGDFERALARNAAHERMLAADGALIVKLWFHLSKDEQRRRLKREAGGAKAWKVSPLAKRFSKRYDDFVRASERALRTTDMGESPWHVIEATDPRYRDLTAGTVLLERLERHLDGLAQSSAPVPAPRASVATDEASPSILGRVDLAARIEQQDYRRELDEQQARLNALAWLAFKRKRHTVAVFEGWDAAGKGGAIRRVLAAMDARLCRAISIAAPTDEERAQHYLWRFWRHLPRAGYSTIYDRSWYGRVLVERVEGFASHDEWSRAYHEINDFEEQLADHGVIVLKFWLHISPEEQLRRFEEREATPWKQHKITAEDWRNREKWGDYEAAVNEMVSRTSTAAAPWTLVPGEDKRFARIEVLKTFASRLESALD